jgi:hypothetical protein
VQRDAYLVELVRLAGPRVGPSRDTGRRAYVARLVELAKGSPTATLPMDDVAAALATIKPRATEILDRLAGALAQRKRRLSPGQRAYLSALEATPDLLTPIAQQRSERAHMAAIAFFLDAKRAGAIATRCRAAFRDLVLDHRPADAHFDELDLSRATVQIEHDLGAAGRVDIAITSLTALVYIEGKVDAAEGQDQLKDYAAALAKHAGSRQPVLVYLTRRGASGPGKGVSCVHLTFNQLLDAWLPICVEQKGGVADYLATYLKTVAVELVRCVGHGGFDEWHLAHRRLALDYIERTTTEEEP